MEEKVSTTVAESKSLVTALEKKSENYVQQVIKQEEDSRHQQEEIRRSIRSVEDSLAKLDSATRNDAYDFQNFANDLAERVDSLENGLRAEYGRIDANADACDQLWKLNNDLQAVVNNIRQTPEASPPWRTPRDSRTPLDSARNGASKTPLVSARGNKVPGLVLNPPSARSTGTKEDGSWDSPLAKAPVVIKLPEPELPVRAIESKAPEKPEIAQIKTPIRRGNLTAPKPKIEDPLSDWDLSGLADEIMGKKADKLESLGFSDDD